MSDGVTHILPQESDRARVQELFDLLEGTSDAPFLLSDGDEVCSWNKAAEKLLGYTAAAALHKTLPNLLYGRDPLDCAFNQVLTQSPFVGA